MSEPTPQEDIDAMTNLLRTLGDTNRSLTLSLRDIHRAEAMIEARIVRSRPVRLGLWLVEKLGRISDNFNGRTQ